MSHERPTPERLSILITRLTRLSKRRTATKAGFTTAEALAEADDLFGYKEGGWGNCIKYTLNKMRNDGLIERTGQLKNSRYVAKKDTTNGNAGAG